MTALSNIDKFLKEGQDIRKELKKAILSWLHNKFFILVALFSFSKILNIVVCGVVTH